MSYAIHTASQENCVFQATYHVLYLTQCCIPCNITQVYFMKRCMSSNTSSFGCAYVLCKMSKETTRQCRGLNSLRPPRATRRPGRGRNELRPLQRVAFFWQRCNNPTPALLVRYKRGIQATDGYPHVHCCKISNISRIEKGVYVHYEICRSFSPGSAGCV